MRRRSLSTFCKLGYEVNLSARWATERKGRLALVVCYRKISLAQNVHADQGVDVWADHKLSDPHHGEHHHIGEADIDQVAGGGQRATADAHIRAAN
ncbi:MAG: hypothetical protein ABSF25_14235 [Bryobacteraceae bacterium]|jgi:hypothetical protein